MGDPELLDATTVTTTAAGADITVANANTLLGLANIDPDSTWNISGLAATMVAGAALNDATAITVTDTATAAQATTVGAATNGGGTGPISIADVTDYYTSIQAMLGTEGGVRAVNNVSGNITANGSGAANNIDMSAFGTGATAGVGIIINSLAAGDTVEGGQANDTINAAGGDDLINGNDGNDSIDGADNDDTINGGEGNDIILAGGGNDSVSGGVGADSIDLSGGGNDIVVQNAGDSLAATSETVGAFFVADQTITFAGGLDIITDFAAGAGADVLTIGTTTSQSLLGASSTVGGIGWLSGNWNAVTQTFMIMADGTGTDTLVLNGSQWNTGSVLSRSVLLQGVDSDALRNSNFGGVDFSASYTLGTTTLAATGYPAGLVVVDPSASVSVTNDGTAVTVTGSADYVQAAVDTVDLSAVEGADGATVNVYAANTALTAAGGAIVGTDSGTTTVAVQDDLILATGTFTNVDAITLGTGVDVTLSRAKNALITTAAGANIVTLSDAGAATGAAEVESYVLAAGNNTFTMGANQTISAVNMADGSVLTLDGAFAGTVTGLKADLTNTATGALSATLVTTGGGTTTVSSVGASSVTVANGTVATGDTIELAGSDAKSVTGLVGNLSLAASNTGVTTVSSTGATSFTVAANAAAGNYNVNANGMADNTTLTLTGGAAAKTATITNIEADVAAGGLSSQLNVTFKDITGNAATVTTGTAATSVTGFAAGDTITAAAALLADGTLLTLSGPSAFTVTGLQGDLTSSSSGAVGVTSAVVANQTLTNTGTGLITQDATLLADNTALTVAGAGAGGFTINGLRADLTSTASGAVTANLVAVASQSSVNNGAGALALNAAALVDGSALITSGTGAGAVTVTGLKADLTNTATGALSATLVTTGGGTTTVSSVGASSVTVANGTVATGDTIELAGSDAKSVTGLVGNLSLAASNTGVTTVSSTGATSFTVAANAAAGNYNVNANGMADNTTLTLTGGAAAKTATITNIEADVAAGGLSSQLNVTFKDITGNAATVTTGTAATSVTGFAAGDTITAAAALLADGTLLTLSGPSAFTVTGLQGDLTSSSSGAVGVTSVAVANQTLTNTGTGLITQNATLLADNASLTVAGAGAGGFTITGLAADLTSTASGSVSATLANVAGQTSVNTGSGTVTINNGAFIAGSTLTINGAGQFAVTGAAPGFVGNVTLAADADNAANLITFSDGNHTLTNNSGTEIDVNIGSMTGDILTLGGNSNVALAGLQSTNEIAFGATTGTVTTDGDGLLDGATLTATGTAGASLTVGTAADRTQDLVNGDFAVGAGYAGTLNIYAGTGRTALNQSITLGSGTNNVYYASATIDSSTAIVGTALNLNETLTLTGNTAIIAADLQGLVNIDNVVFSNTTTAVAVTTLDPMFTANATYTFNASSLTTGSLTFDGANDGAGTIAAYSVTGGQTDDTITGGAGADTLLGGTGSDSLTGNAGVDSLVGGGGGDTILGGTGADILSFSAGNVVATGGQDADTIRLSTGTAQVTYVAGDVNAAAAIDSVTGFNLGAATGDLLGFTAGVDFGAGIDAQLGAGAWNGEFTASLSAAFADTTAGMARTTMSLGANTGGNAVTAGTNLVFFTNTTGTTFAQALGTTTITGITNQTVDTGVLAVWFDADRVVDGGAAGAMVVGMVGLATGATTITSGSGFAEISVVGMTAADYANINAANFQFIA